MNLNFTRKFHKDRVSLSVSPMSRSGGGQDSPMRLAVVQRRLRVPESARASGAGVPSRRVNAHADRGGSRVYVRVRGSLVPAPVTHTQRRGIVWRIAT